MGLRLLSREMGAKKKKKKKTGVAYGGRGKQKEKGEEILNEEGKRVET